MPIPKGAKMSMGLAIVADLKAICASDIFVMTWLVLYIYAVLRQMMSICAFGSCPGEGCDRFNILSICNLTRRQPQPLVH